MPFFYGMLISDERVASDNDCRMPTTELWWPTSGKTTRKPLQAQMDNIQADLQREETEKPATGILFGNGFRLVRPKDRPEQFTQKC
jgi:hypothetical protein